MTPKSIHDWTRYEIVYRYLNTLFAIADRGLEHKLSWFGVDVGVDVDVDVDVCYADDIVCWTELDTRRANDLEM